MNIEEFLAKLPPHKCSLMITHNECRSHYQTVEKDIKQREDMEYSDNWISEEQKQLAIERNEIWTIQWYPDTPVGFYTASAAELGPLLDYVSNPENID